MSQMANTKRYGKNYPIKGINCKDCEGKVGTFFLLFKLHSLRKKKNLHFGNFNEQEPISTYYNCD